ncbi:MAG: class I SAM-dependent methyltransferase [Thermomicrobiales bacterium]
MPFDVSLIPMDEPLRIIIGAGSQSWPGWIATHREDLDLLRRDTWVAFLKGRLAEALLCEHVWEHLTEPEGRAAAKLCFEFLTSGGYIRCAVPDANFRDEAYQRTVRVGGPGPADHAAADHKIVYEYKRFCDVFAGAGFVVDLLEYCDEQGRFHFNYWDPADGPVYRSLRSDHRNQDGKLGFVSLILDAKKP